jgi:hypothetical protein
VKPQPKVSAPLRAPSNLMTYGHPITAGLESRMLAFHSLI